MFRKIKQSKLGLESAFFQMNFNRNKNFSLGPDFIGSSRSFIEKFYSSYNNDPPVSPLSKESFHEVEKSIINNNETSNFSIIDHNSPHQTQESELKTNLIRKFEDFLENLRSDELISNEDEIFSKFIKINSTLNQTKGSKTPDISSYITNNTSTNNKSVLTNKDNLTRKYENLMIINNELDLELINANLQLREKNNMKVKGLLEIQRKIHKMQEENENLMRIKDGKKEKLSEMMQELKSNDEKEEKDQKELAMILESKKIIVEREKIPENSQRTQEIEIKKAVLKGIEEKNLNIVREIRDLEKITSKTININETISEIEKKREAKHNLEKWFSVFERETEENQKKKEKEVSMLREGISKTEDLEKNNEKHKIFEEKFERPISYFKTQKIEMKKKKEEIIEAGNKIIEESLEMKKSIKTKFAQNREKNQENLKVSSHERDILFSQREKAKENLKNLEISREILLLDLQKIEFLKENMKEEQKISYENFNNLKNELIQSLESQKVLLLSENEKKSKFNSEKENIRVRFFAEKINFLKDLRKKMALFKDLRNQISEEIGSLQSKSKELSQSFEIEKKSNKELHNKSEDLTVEISQIKENIAKCSQENEEICSSFKSQIEENSAKEREIQDLIEINEKFKILTANQMNEIASFNERNNQYFKEIQLLEKGNLKEWNNYLKEKEKAKKKKK